MPKTLDDVKAALTKLDGGSELVELVSTLAIQASEAQSHKTGLSTLHSTHNKVISELKALGYQGGDVSPFVSDLKLKLERAQEAEERANNTGSKLTEGEKRILALEKQIEKLSTSAEQSKAEAQRAAASLKSRTLRDALLPKMKDRIFGADLRAEKLINDGLVTMSESGAIIYKKGDEELDIEKGIEEYLKDPANAEDLKNTQNPGVGSGAGRAGVQGKTMARATFEALDPNSQMTFIQSGGRPV